MIKASILSLIFISNIAIIIGMICSYLDTPLMHVDFNKKCIRVITPDGVKPCNYLAKNSRYEIVYVSR